MGFKIADLFVSLRMVGEAAVTSGLARVRLGLQNITRGFEQLSIAASRWLLSLGVLGGYTIAQIIDEQRGQEALQAALRATGNEGANTYEKLNAAARRFQKSTTQDADAIKALMARLLNMGASVGDLEGLSAMGIGLGRALFGGDMAAGAEAAFKAQQGNFRELQRLIPAVKNATTAQEAYNIVVKTAQSGLKQEAEFANTLEGQMRRLKHSVDDMVQSFGKILLPVIEQAVQFLGKMTAYIDSLSTAQKENILHWFKLGAGVLAVIVLGPRLISLMTAFGTIAIGAIQAVSSALIFLATTPIGWVIIGIAGLVTGFAYLVGAGDTATQRIGSGFATIAGFLDPMLGSFEGFANGIKMIWDLVISHATDVFIGFKTVFLNGWEHLSEGVEQVWWALFANLDKAWLILRDGARATAEIIRGTFEVMTDNLGGLFANMFTMMEEREIYDQIMEKAKVSGKSLTADQVRAEIDAELAARKAYNKQGTEYAIALHQSEHEARLAAIGTEHDADMAYRQEQISEQAAIDKAQRQSNREHNDTEGQKQIEENKKQRDADWNDGLDKMKKGPSLSGNIMAMLEELKKKLGVDEFGKMIQDIMGLKINPADMQVGGMPGFEGGGDQKLKFRSLEEEFKKQVALSMFGDDFRKREQDEAKRQREQALEEARKQTRELEKLNETLESQAMAGVMV